MAELFGAESSAVISPCGLYRYRLARTWNTELPACVFVMLNPSTADAEQDDPTIRRCIGFARSWNCGGLVVVNLFAYRATDPAELQRAVDPVGPDNDGWILNECTWGGPVVVAWGAHGTLLHRDGAVTELLSGGGLLFKTRCLGRTSGGHPRHPLYVRADAELIPVGNREGGTR